MLRPTGWQFVEIADTREDAEMMTQSLSTPRKQSPLGRITAVFVYVFEKIMPDPYVFAVLLTFVGAVLAWLFAPGATVQSIAAAWYSGIFSLFT